MTDAGSASAFPLAPPPPPPQPAIAVTASAASSAGAQGRPGVVDRVGRGIAAMLRGSPAAADRLTMRRPPTIAHVEAQRADGSRRRLQSAVRRRRLQRPVRTAGRKGPPRPTAGKRWKTSDSRGPEGRSVAREGASWEKLCGCACIVGGSGLLMRHADRGGGAPPTPPPRPAPPSSPGSAASLNGLHRHLRPHTRREEPPDGSRQVPGGARSRRSCSRRASTRAWRSGPPRDYEAYVASALDGLNPLSPEARRMQRYFSGQRDRDRPRRRRPRDAARRSSSSTEACARRSS